MAFSICIIKIALVLLLIKKTYVNFVRKMLFCSHVPTVRFVDKARSHANLWKVITYDFSLGEDWGRQRAFGHCWCRHNIAYSFRWLVATSCQQRSVTWGPRVDGHVVCTCTIVNLLGSGHWSFIEIPIVTITWPPNFQWGNHFIYNWESIIVIHPKNLKKLSHL